MNRSLDDLIAMCNGALIEHRCYVIAEELKIRLELEKAAQLEFIRNEVHRQRREMEGEK